MKNGLTREGGQGAAGDEDMVSEEWADQGGGAGGGRG